MGYLESVPAQAGHLEKLDPHFLCFVVEKTQLQLPGFFDEDREVGADAVVTRFQRIGLSRQSAHAFLLAPPGGRATSTCRSSCPDPAPP